MIYYKLTHKTRKGSIKTIAKGKTLRVRTLNRNNKPVELAIRDKENMENLLDAFNIYYDFEEITMYEFLTVCNQIAI
jgi:hypothetical protein